MTRLNPLKYQQDLYFSAELNNAGLKYNWYEGEIYTFVHKGQEIFKGKADDAKETLKGYFKDSKSGGLEKYLDEVAL